MIVISHLQIRDVLLEVQLGVFIFLGLLMVGFIHLKMFLYKTLVGMEVIQWFGNLVDYLHLVITWFIFLIMKIAVLRQMPVQSFRLLYRDRT